MNKALGSTTYGSNHLMQRAKTFSANVFSVFFALFAGGFALHAATRPNIVLVLCDDLGYADVGFNGSRDIVTPELDKLAKAGTIFTSAYVTHPFCGPSRMGV